MWGVTYSEASFLGNDGGALDASVSAESQMKASILARVGHGLGRKMGLGEAAKTSPKIPSWKCLCSLRLGLGPG